MVISSLVSFQSKNSNHCKRTVHNVEFFLEYRTSDHVFRFESHSLLALNTVTSQITTTRAENLTNFTNDIRSFRLFSPIDIGELSIG